ncbi:MAG: NAD-dependent epimerase/dehydratase family protein, partial [Anaerolineales bacterium]
MKVMISGGSGLIGVALTRSLLDDGHEVWWLSRNPAKIRAPQGVHVLAWDGRTVYHEWLGALSQMDAMVNLAGSTIGQWPWSQARKRGIMESRVNAGRAIAQAFEKASPRPP